MTSRRDALKSFGGGAVLALTGATIVATTSCVPAEAPAAEPDPTYAAIEAHKAAWAAWHATDDDTPDGVVIEADVAEQEAWEAVCEIEPSTLTGLSEMAGYVGRHASRELVPDGDTLQRAFITVALSAARLAYHDGRAA